jgi:hypothetical protein
VTDKSPQLRSVAFLCLRSIKALRCSAGSLLLPLEEDPLAVSQITCGLETQLHCTSVCNLSCVFALEQRPLARTTFAGEIILQYSILSPCVSGN